MECPNILLIEDEESLNRAVYMKLEKEGYRVYTAYNLAQGEMIFKREHIALVICDIGLPDGSGLDFCKKIRRASNVFFLFLTALDTEVDMVNGYESGADDYITKPFSLMVLLSKVNAVMKRVRPVETNILKSGDITFYEKEKRVKKCGEYLSLTANEIKLLSVFMNHAGRILSKNQLLEALWDADGNFVDENTLAVNIRRLREKIEEDPSSPAYVKNIRGLGYIWERACEKK